MYSYTVLALVALAQANPLLVARQGVTAALSPSAPAPAGCTGSVSYTFGIVANNVSSSAVAKRQATQIQDGQVQGATGTAKAVSQITESVPLPQQQNSGLIASTVVKSKLQRALPKPFLKSQS